MSRRRPGWALAVALAVAALAPLLLAGASALARSNGLFPYPFAEVWPTAVRYLRIDRGATLRERDAESGYVLFDLPEGSKVYKGSLELVLTTDSEGREATRVVVNLPDLPRHFESTLLDRLALKVRDEYGSPAPPPPRSPAGADQGKKKRPPDAGRPPGSPAATSRGCPAASCPAPSSAEPLSPGRARSRPPRPPGQGPRRCESPCRPTEPRRASPSSSTPG